MLCSICLNLRAAQYEILNALTCYMLAFLILDFSCPCCHFKQVFKVAALKFLSSTELFCVFFFPKPSVIYKCWKACASLNFFFPCFICLVLLRHLLSVVICWSYSRCHWLGRDPEICVAETIFFSKESVACFTDVHLNLLSA